MTPQLVTVGQLRCVMRATLDHPVGHVPVGVIVNVPRCVVRNAAPLKGAVYVVCPTVNVTANCADAAAQVSLAVVAVMSTSANTSGAVSSIITTANGTYFP